jgi:hypothetical protein
LTLVAARVWDRVDVSAWALREVEASGSTEALWLEEPTTGLAWLHKDTVIPRNGVEQGEDWSEVVSTQIAVLLGAPCATTRLCMRNGRRGSLSLSIVPKGHDLWEGLVVMERAGVPGYFPHLEGQPSAVDPDRPGVKRPGHSLANIRSALVGVVPPPGFAGPGDATGFEVFAGYTILDALIANPDRHEQNWAILAPPLTSSAETLAPSYDHASSLGHNLHDAKRGACIRDPGRLAAWAARGTARRFEHSGKPPTLVEHAAHAVALCGPRGAHWWRSRLHALSLDPVREALTAHVVPEMSDLAVTFALDLLDLNLRRLRDALGDCA